MYGLINRFTAVPGKRNELASCMLEDVGILPGCRSFVVARDSKDPDALWITEVWDSEAAWQASLEAPAVKASIDRAMSLIASFGEPAITEPIGGIGL